MKNWLCQSFIYQSVYENNNCSRFLYKFAYLDFGDVLYDQPNNKTVKCLSQKNRTYSIQCCSCQQLPTIQKLNEPYSFVDSFLTLKII